MGFVARTFRSPDVRVMGDEGAVRVFFALSEQRGNVQSVDRVVLRDEALRVGEPEEGREQVFGNDGLIGFRPGLDMESALQRVVTFGFCPGGDERDAGAAFVSGTFTGFERPVVGVEAGAAGRDAAGMRAESAVVGGEDDEGVLREAELVELVEQRAEAGVHAFDHRGVIFFNLRDIILGAGVIRVFVASVEPGVGLDGHVDGVMGHVQVERLAELGRIVERLDCFRW